MANNRIRQVSSSGTIFTVAGNGVGGFSGDGGPATAAQIYQPRDVAVDAAGNLFIADSSNARVRRVSPSGVITTVAGNGVLGFSGDGGPATAAQFSYLIGIAVDAVGNIFIADATNRRVRKVSLSGVITTVAGIGGGPGFSGDGGPATAAQMNAPVGVAVDAVGDIYIADYSDHRVRRVVPATAPGTINTVAGNGTQGFSGDGGPATAAQLNNAQAVAVDATGNIIIGDFQDNRIRRVSASGVISTVAGTGAAGFSGDGGPAIAAQINAPDGVAVDAAGVGRHAR